MGDRVREGLQWEMRGKGKRGDMKETQKVRRMNILYSSIEYCMGGTSRKLPETWDVRGFEDSIWMTLAKMNKSANMEPEQPNSNS